MTGPSPALCKADAPWCLSRSSQDHVNDTEQPVIPHSLGRPVSEQSISIDFGQKKQTELLKPAWGGGGCPLKS